MAGRLNSTVGSSGSPLPSSRTTVKGPLRRPRVMADSAYSHGKMRSAQPKSSRACSDGTTTSTSGSRAMRSTSDFVNSPCRGLPGPSAGSSSGMRQRSRLRAMYDHFMASISKFSGTAQTIGAPWLSRISMRSGGGAGERWGRRVAIGMHFRRVDRSNHSRIAAARASLCERLPCPNQAERVRASTHQRTRAPAPTVNSRPCCPTALPPPSPAGWSC